MVTDCKLQSQAIFRAIADPTRREILNLLRRRSHSVGEIAGNFRSSRPAISKHLRLLKSAGLVISHRHGTANICHLNAQPLHAVHEWVGNYRVYWKKTLRNLKKHVEESR
ncbi:MAG: metalloregulator ArsR/SmtB family transcription factor [Steroidobacteraceae bacterium]